MSKDRYGCTNGQKDLPIAHLDDGVCANSKTISRSELETRVLDAIPARLLSVGSTTSLQDEINKQLTATTKTGERDQEKLKSHLSEVSRKQEAIAAQITDRILNGQPQIEAFNKLLDDLQSQHDENEASLRTQQTKLRGPPKTFTVNPSMFTSAIGALTAVARAGASEHDDVQRHFNFLRDWSRKW